MMLLQDDRVALAVYDHMLKDIAPDAAALIANQVRAELRREPNQDELYVVKVVDSAGKAHAVVMGGQKPGAPTLFRFDIRGLRRAARREMGERFEVDLALNEEGTEI